MMSAAKSCSAKPPDSVGFIDNNDAGRIILAFFEKVAHAARAYADKHFHEVRTRNREEGNVGFTGDRARQQGFAGAWRPDKQHTLGNSSAQFLELLRVFQELNDFLQLFLGLVRPGDI